jgi:hypothetical protein
MVAPISMTNSATRLIVDQKREPAGPAVPKCSTHNMRGNIKKGMKSKCPKPILQMKNPLPMNSAAAKVRCAEILSQSPA